MVHKSEIEKYSGSMNELSEDIGNLRYDRLSDFLQMLSDKIAKDGEKDRSRQRIKLATSLENTSKLLKQAKIEIDTAWVISEPFM